MGPIGSHETSVSNHLLPRSNPVDERIQFNRGGYDLAQRIYVFHESFFYYFFLPVGLHVIPVRIQIYWRERRNTVRLVSLGRVSINLQ